MDSTTKTVELKFGNFRPQKFGSAMGSVTINIVQFNAYISTLLLGGLEEIAKNKLGKFASKVAERVAHIAKHPDPQAIGMALGEKLSSSERAVVEIAEPETGEITLTAEFYAGNKRMAHIAVRFKTATGKILYVEA